MIDEFGQDLKVVGGYHVEHRADSIVTGTYRFSCDHSMGNKLYGKILGSPHAHARIVSIDTSRAEAMEGVEAVITYEDNPLWNQELLCWGHEVAAVAATDEYLAERALLEIDVEYEVLPFNIHPEDAMAPGAPLTGTYDGTNLGPPATNDRGDVEAGFAASDVIIEETVGWCRPHAQNNVETESGIAWWDGEDVYGYDCNQAPHGNNRGIASALGVPLNKCHIKVLAAGGGFGGRGQSREPVTAALLAKKAGKPVQIMRPRRLQTPSRRNHYGPKLTMKMGCKNDGTPMAIETTWWGWGGRNGARGNYWETQDTTFNCPNMKYIAYGVATNSGVASGYR
jgi:CO/xanthine dehydrogenase Mo-binding subunit